MHITHLHQVAQRAADLERAVAFYGDTLGLRHIATFDPPGLGFFDLGGTRLLVERNAPSALLYLGVDDIAGAWEALGAAGVELVDPPHLIFSDDTGVFGPARQEEWMAFFKDSEGNLVGLVERRPG
ncbi:MAG TPA: methylmalonyl-CoA epimerase [Actinobacteria bacterium]|nr:methylmalonyl-CoA epimerase [Actinomycetota bacterium]